MSKQALSIIVLAAGCGTRMKSSKPKVLHSIGYRPMVQHVLKCVEPMRPTHTVVVVGPDTPQVTEAIAPHTAVTQNARLGTGHAVITAMPYLTNASHGTVLVLMGDAPLVTTKTLVTLVRKREETGAALTVLGFKAADPTGYGRLVATGSDLRAISEEKDADLKTRQISLCNSGVIAFDASVLPELLSDLNVQNASGEYLLTDAVACARSRGLAVTFCVAPEAEVMGVNTRKQLSAAEAIFQARLRDQFMRDGVTMIAPDTVFFAHDTQIGRDVCIEPNVVFGPGVTVADQVNIRAFSHIEGATINTGAVIGPYARLRPGSDIRDGARIGNFVEVKQATISPGAKINHLSYIGDSFVGAKANIGAGTITCNYDGFNKSRTFIGEHAFIGSNTALVAPIKVGDGAIVGAGSTLTNNVDANALAVERADVEQRAGWAERFRAAQKSRKSNFK